MFNQWTVLVIVQIFPTTVVKHCNIEQLGDITLDNCCNKVYLIKKILPIQVDGWYICC